MTKRFATLASLLLLAGCSTENVSQTEAPATEPVEVTETAFNTSGAPTVKINVPDVVCESCVAKVKEALTSQPGVKDVMVSLEDKIATVAVDKQAFEPQEAIALLVDYQFTNSAMAGSSK